MKLAAHAESFPPKPDEIHVQNGTLRIDGSFLAVSYTHLVSTRSTPGAIMLLPFVSQFVS